MANLGLAAVEKVREFLLAADGLEPRSYAIAVRDMVQPPRICNASVTLRHVQPGLSDASTDTVHPAVFLYCDRLENRLERKFTAFSGRVYIVAEAWVSGETLASIDGDAARLVEAVMDVLADHRGQWTPELAFDGKADARFQPCERGGRNYRQTARVEIELIAHA
ncbi:MAG: hypothetical protein GC160_19550 [Acidobacteria bacterium]|nr:hypothetical protein [Acidobacteriota bacterium]